MSATRLVFGYEGGEKSVLTINNITKEECVLIAEAISDTGKELIMINMPTAKDDVLLVNKKKLLFFYATPAVESDKKNKD